MSLRAAKGLTHVVNRQNGGNVQTGIRLDNFYTNDYIARRLNEQRNNNQTAESMHKDLTPFEPIVIRTTQTNYNYRHNLIEDPIDFFYRQNPPQNDALGARQRWMDTVGAFGEMMAARILELLNIPLQVAVQFAPVDFRLTNHNSTTFQADRPAFDVIDVKYKVAPLQNRMQIHSTLYQSRHLYMLLHETDRHNIQFAIYVAPIWNRRGTTLEYMHLPLHNIDEVEMMLDDLSAVSDYELTPSQ